VTRRLLQAMAGAPHGGAEVFFLRLAVALQHAGEQQRVLIRRHPLRAKALNEAGISVAELGFRGPFDLATRLAFRREIVAWKPDLVLTWMSRATQLCPRGDFVHVARLGGYYDLRHYRRCDHLIGNTRAIVAYAVGRGWPAARVHYLPNFVPDCRILSRLARCDRRDPPAARPLALALGRLHPNKGFDILLQALALVPEVNLWIAGEGPLRAELMRQTQRLGVGERVRFLGWREDVANLLAQADLVVCSSRHEPLGNVVIEAWAAEVPVIALASDGPAALIEHGVSGLLVPLPGQRDGGAAGLAQAILRLAESPDLRRKLARGGREAYEAGFTEAAVVARYRRFFDEVTA